MFAQHYAERLEAYDATPWTDFRRHYNGKQVTEILAYLRAITLGNLTGNTLDAFCDHLNFRARVVR